MGQHVQEIMTDEVQAVPRRANLREVARIMKERQIGDVLVTDEDGRLCGIVTDRDLVVRAVAEGRDPEKTSVGDICSGDVVQVQPSSTIEQTIELMRTKAIRRIPVVKDGRPVGIISIGDLAQLRDSGSVLGQISAAEPNN